MTTKSHKVSLPRAVKYIFTTNMSSWSLVIHYYHKKTLFIQKCKFHEVTDRVL